MFLVHNPIQYSLWFEFNEYFSSDPMLETFAMFFASFVFSIALIWILSQGYLFKRVLFRIK